MKCPKCGTPLNYDYMVDQYYDDTIHEEKWVVTCPAQDCNFEGRIWQTYKLQEEELIQNES